MRGLTTRGLLALSDAGWGRDWVARGVLLTGYAWPDASPAQCAALSIGVRDRLVIALRLQTFGRVMRLRSRCSACGLDLEAPIDLAAILGAEPAEPPPDVRVEIDGEAIVARLPSSADLLEANNLTPDIGEWALYERCLMTAPTADRALVRQRLGEAFAMADPLMALDLEIECHGCHARHVEPFDIVSCFWKEIDTAAERAAFDVHALASTYGWSEEQILSMTPARRARYLALGER